MEPAEIIVLGVGGLLSALFIWWLFFIFPNEGNKSNIGLLELYEENNYFNSLKSCNEHTFFSIKAEDWNALDNKDARNFWKDAIENQVDIALGGI